MKERICSIFRVKHLPIVLTDPEEEGCKILRNVGDYLPVDAV
jgi:predicted SPOUT superfamily RNA methylase MTH1